MKEEERIYRTFTKELEEWSRTDKVPSMGNQDIRYYLELQKERLRSRSLRMEYRFKLRGEHLDNIYSMAYKDQIYTNRFTSSSYLQSTIFSRDGEVVYEKEDPQSFFQTITWMDRQKPEEMYNCPNCGAVSSIETLLGGCPYCHTHFLISDLFPKVTNYYFEHNFFMNTKELKRKMFKWVFGGILAIFLISMPAAIQAYGLGGLLVSLIVSCIPGAFLGYLAMSLGMLVHLLKAAAGEVVRLPNVAGTKKKINSLLKPYDPNFSYEHFCGEIVNLLKIILFTDDLENSPVYEGQEKIPDFSAIVESVYEGSMGLNRGWVKDGYCYLNLDVYMSNIYDTGRLSRKDDMFRMVVCKSVKKAADFGFSIKKVQCASCGGSFDATRQRVCPYCGNPYHLGEDGWVVLSIKVS